MASAKFVIPKMACGNCFNIIKNAVSKISGVKDLTCDLGEKTVSVEYDGAAVARETIAEKLKKIGFAPENE